MAAHFEPAQIIEICLTAGMSSMINCLHAAFRTEVGPQIGEALALVRPLAYPNVPEG
jgi:hypothetical protein